jgi:N6-adenosine-specific RNA methylase IME4
MIPFPDKKYKTIYMDPPWPVKYSARKQRPNQTKWPYPTMTISEIENMPIENLADKECNLFLWTTQTFLHHGIHLIEKWGFTYHVCITWDKKKGLTFFGFHRRTEFLLYGHCGLDRDTFYKSGSAIPTLISSPSRKHSRKPPAVYDYIERQMPDPKIELFARPFNSMFPTRSGWDVWGNEVST